MVPHIHDGMLRCACTNKTNPGTCRDVQPPEHQKTHHCHCMATCIQALPGGPEDATHLHEQPSGLELPPELWRVRPSFQGLRTPQGQPQAGSQPQVPPRPPQSPPRSPRESPEGQLPAPSHPKALKLRWVPLRCPTPKRAVSTPVHTPPSAPKPPPLPPPSPDQQLQEHHVAAAAAEHQTHRHGRVHSATPSNEAAFPGLHRIPLPGLCPAAGPTTPASSRAPVVLSPPAARSQSPPLRHGPSYNSQQPPRRLPVSSRGGGRAGHDGSCSSALGGGRGVMAALMWPMRTSKGNGLEHRSPPGSSCPWPFLGCR